MTARPSIKASAASAIAVGVERLKRVLRPIDRHFRIRMRAGHQAMLLRNLWFYGQADVFGNIGIETFSPCNRKCGFCPVGLGKREVDKMPEALFERIIDPLAARGYRGEIGLHFYNEPLLDPRLPELRTSPIPTRHQRRRQSATLLLRLSRQRGSGRRLT